MANNGPFGFDPEDFDRVAREAGEGLREALDGLSRMFTSAGERAGWATLFDEVGRRTRTPAEPETTGETGAGVWVVYTVDADGSAQIEQVYPSELDALRANKNNTDPTRKVRFLPYGMAVSVFDAARADEATAGGAEEPE